MLCWNQKHCFDFEIRTSNTVCKKMVLFWLHYSSWTDKLTECFLQMRLFFKAFIDRPELICASFSDTVKLS